MSSRKPVSALAMISFLVTVSLAAAPAAAGKPVGTAEAPYESADAYGCWDEACNATADAESGVLVLSDTISGYTAFSYLEGEIVAVPILSEEVDAVKATARIQMDLDTEVRAENGTASITVDNYVAGYSYEHDGFSYYHIADNAAGACTDCEDLAPSALHGIYEFSVVIARSDGGTILPGPVPVAYVINADAHVTTSRDETESPDFQASVNNGASSARVAVPSDPTQLTYDITVSTGAADSIHVTNAEPQPEPPTLASASYTIQATLLSMDLEAAKHPADEHVRTTPPGKLRENTTIEVAGPYDAVHVTNTCTGQSRCEPTAADAGTGRMQMAMRSEDAAPVVGNQREYAEVGLLKRIDLEQAADSIDVQVTVRIDSAMADSVYQRTEGAAYLYIVADVRHDGCDYYSWCSDGRGMWIVEDGDGYPGDPGEPTQRSDETIVLDLHLERQGGDVMPPGELFVEVTTMAVVDVSPDDEAFAPLGLSYSMVSMDATLATIRVELDPGAYLV